MKRAPLLQLLETGHRVQRIIRPTRPPSILDLVETRRARMALQHRDGLWMVDASGRTEDGSVGEGKSNLTLLMAQIAQGPFRCSCALLTVRVDAPTRIETIVSAGTRKELRLEAGDFVRLEVDPVQDPVCLRCLGAGWIENLNGPFDVKRQMVFRDDYRTYRRLIRELLPGGVIVVEEVQEAFGKQGGSWQQRAPYRHLIMAMRKLCLWQMWNGPSLWDMDAYYIVDRIQKRFTMQTRTTCKVFRRSWFGDIRSKEDRWGKMETTLTRIPAAQERVWHDYESIAFQGISDEMAIMEELERGKSR